jgi:hypothetical protein
MFQRNAAQPRKFGATTETTVALHLGGVYKSFFAPSRAKNTASQEGELVCTLDHRRKSRSAKRTKKNSKNISLKFLWLAFRKILANSFFACFLRFRLHLQSYLLGFFAREVRLLLVRPQAEKSRFRQKKTHMFRLVD